MLSRFRNAQRGQALVESILFIPLFLFAVFALIFFGRLGVAAERAQTAVRYANLVTFRQGNAYTVATVYDLLSELLNPSTSELGPLCLQPNTLSPNPSNTPASSAIAALTQSQPNVTTTPLPSTAAFWIPDLIVSSQCNPLSVALTSGTYGVGGSNGLPLSITSFQIQGQISTPSYLKSVVGSTATTTGSMAFLNVATPNMLVACLPGLSVVLDVLSDLQSHGGSPTCNANSNPISF